MSNERVILASGSRIARARLGDSRAILLERQRVLAGERLRARIDRITRWRRLTTTTTTTTKLCSYPQRLGLFPTVPRAFLLPASR